jgi:hypothetical protein
MEERNFYLDIKESIKKYFTFLKYFGFSKFEEEQIAHEVHFKAANPVATIDISFEVIPSTPIWARMNEYFIDNIELQNEEIKAYQTRLSANYQQLFEQYLKTKEDVFLHQIASQYAVSGKKINDNYLLELSAIFKRNAAVLHGDFEMLKSNTELLGREYEMNLAAERIRKGIFTLEYQFLSNNVYDAFEEFQGIAEIRKYLSERPEIKRYRVLDCYMNEISW